MPVEFVSGETYTRTAEELCPVLFNAATIGIIGDNPECSFDNSRTILTITLGMNPSYVENSPVVFNSDVIRSSICVQPIQIFLLNTI